MCFFILFCAFTKKKGTQEVGKTCILQKYVKNKFSKDYRPTIGADFWIQLMQTEYGYIHLQLWDIAGQPKFQANSVPIYQKSKIIYVIYDITKLILSFFFFGKKIAHFRKTYPK